MGLIVLSVVMSVLTACIVWLAIGNTLPRQREEKWNAGKNIGCYFLMILAPVYLLIFTFF